MKELLKWPAISWITAVSLSCSINNPYVPTVFDRLASQGPVAASAAGPAEPAAEEDSNQPEEGRATRVRHNDLLYEIIPDTISALTCPQDVFIGNQNFTLTVGAYNNHGLQLSERFKRSHNIRRDSPPQRVRRLIEQSYFKRAKARVSLHDESDMDVILQTGKAAISAVLPRFDNPTTLNFLSRGEAVFSSRSGTAINAQNSGKFQASLPIPGANFIEWLPALGEDTLGNLLLALTYFIPQDNTIIYTENGQPYGRSYKIEFNSPYKADYMTEIKEENLPETKREGDWECPSSLRFMVHRSISEEDSPFNRDLERYEESLPEEWGNDKEGYCSKSNSLSPAQRALFLDIFGKNQLSQLPFYIGKTTAVRHTGSDGTDEIYTPFITERPCIKFKKPGCYLSHGFYRLEFDPRKLGNCVPINQIEDGRHSNPEYYRICPAFLSICYRRN